MFAQHNDLDVFVPHHQVEGKGMKNDGKFWISNFPYLRITIL